MALTKANNRMIDGAVVNILDFGAVGDGVTDDTAAIQAALNTGKTVYVPEAPVAYLVSTVSMLNEQTIYGDGKWANGLKGDGTGPVIQCGDGSGTIRSHQIKWLRIENNGERCVYSNNAPNFLIENCRLSSVGADAIDLYFSYRATIQDCWITCSGAFTAVNALNNVNGLIIDGNTISGGSAGRAVRVGQSQGVRISNNIIEASLDGIWVASTSDTGDGNCNGVTIWNNYIEQCSTPFVIGKVFTVLGAVVKANYVGNAQNSVIATRTAVIQHGRLRGAEIADNSFYVLNTVEDLVWIFLEVATCDIEGVLYARNYVANTPANTVQKFGTYATNGTVLNLLGAENHYDFGWMDQLPTKRQFVSPWLSANESLALEWFSTDGGDAQFGGIIKTVEIIDATGTLTGCNVALGDSANFQANVAQVDITTLSYTRGRADMTLASGPLDTRVGGYNQYRVFAGAGTGKFRIRITFRAN
jgi:hypothetical protein